MTDVGDQLQAALAERYTVDRELGAGGMATVYLAEDRKHERHVAIKVLKPALAAVLGPDRFLREIRVTAQLNHPHILPLLDSGEADGLLYYVMPYVDGESLRDTLSREKQLPIERAVDVTVQVADALDYAHRHDVIHRDIKPENILLHDGKALVADFGIAVAVHAAGETRLTETGLSVGTPQYMSPEQATGDRVLDGRSDIYSLGCVLYEMLAGEPPHTGPTAQAILARIATDDPRNVSELRSTVPHHVQWAVHKALAKLPADRFDEASALAQAVTGPQSVAAVSAGRGTEYNATVRLRRAVVGLAVTAGALAVAALVLLLRPPSTPTAPLQWLNLHVDRDYAYSGFDLARDGSAITYRGPAAQIFVRELDAREPHALGLVGTFPFFSPDGEWVAGIAGNSGLWRVARGGGPITTFSGPVSGNAAFYRAAWGPDGYIYFTNGHTNGISRISTDEGQTPEPLTFISEEAEHSSRHPEVVSGGLLFTSWWADSSRIMAYRFDTGTLTRVAAGSTPRYLPNGYLVFGTMKGTLQAVAFDSERMEARGTPISVLDGVNVGNWGWVEFDLAENSTLVYQPAWQGLHSLIVVDPTGRESRLLPDAGPFSGGLEISPDGSRLSYSRHVAGASEIRVHSLDGAEWRVERSGRSFFPIWSPDGEYLAYTSDREGHGFALYKKRANGEGEAELLLEHSSAAYPVSWSPDGSILFWDDLAGIGMVRDDGSGEEWAPIPDCVQGCGGYSRLSPDGRYIAYLMKGALYVSDLADPLGTRQQVSIDRGGNPRWSPDGRQIYYYVGDPEELWAAAVEVGDGIRVVDRRKVLDLADRRFDLAGGLGLAIDPTSGNPVFLRREGAPRPDLVAVLNFGEELEARLERR